MAAEALVTHSPAHAATCVLCLRETAFRALQLPPVGPRNHRTHGAEVRAWIDAEKWPASACSRGARFPSGTRTRGQKLGQKASSRGSQWVQEKAL